MFKSYRRRSDAEGVAALRVLAADGHIEGTWVAVLAEEADGLTRSSAGGRPVGAVVDAVLGAAVRRSWLGCGLRGSGVADRCGGVDGLLAGGGASGTAGEPWPSEAVSRSGSTTRAATPQVTAAPAAARSSRRREAPRRIAS
jgi:hypothetical protein